MENWIFYRKDGITEICSVPDICTVERRGKQNKILRFMLTNSGDYNNLMWMCRYVDQARAHRTSLNGMIIFADTSPDQSNTIKVIDPNGDETGYGIIESFTPEQIAGTKYHAFTFELSLLWIGETLGEEIDNGVYKVIQA